MSGHAKAVGGFTLKFNDDAGSDAKVNHLITYVHDLEHLKEALMSGLQRGWFDSKQTVRPSITVQKHVYI